MKSTKEHSGVRSPTAHEGNSMSHLFNMYANGRRCTHGSSPGTIP